MRSLGFSIKQTLARITYLKHWFSLTKLHAITWQPINSKHGHPVGNMPVDMTSLFGVKDIQFSQLSVLTGFYILTFLLALGQQKNSDHLWIYFLTKWIHTLRKTLSWSLIMQACTTLKAFEKWLRDGKFFCCCNFVITDKKNLNPCNSGRHLQYLPAYSPDFNPIEEGFLGMKAWICSNWDYVLEELSGDPSCDPFEMLWSAVFESMTLDKIVGWYKDSGYVV